MEKPQYSETGSGIFFGNYLYDQIVPANHYLRQLNGIIDWERFNRKLIELYNGSGIVGRPPFDPSLVMKIELIAYLYNLTERQAEVYINENLSAKYIVGLAKERYKIERKIGETKQGHGFGHCRYLEILCFAVQAFFTANMLNLKRMVKLLREWVSKPKQRPGQG